MEKVMIVDMLNMYFRAYIVDPSLSSNGHPIGGLKGTLKIIQKLLRELKPTQVYLCWDGREGSSKRKKVNKGYKSGRKPIRLNRNVDLDENQQLQNRIWQQLRLVEYFNEMPFCQLMLEHTEADDLIGFLCSELRHKNKIIVSSDKDFYQLLDNKTIIYRPVQKKLMSRINMMEEYDIHPRNFTLARAMAGDKSDNLKGVKGAGLKTIAKRLPFMKEDVDITIDAVLEACREKVEEEKRGTPKVYEQILLSEDIIKENYEIMQLYTVNISPQNALKIRSCINNYPYQLNKTGILKMMIQDGFAELNWEDLFVRSRNIIKESK